MKICWTWLKVAAVFTKTTFARTEIIVNVNLNFLLTLEMMLFVVEIVLCRMDVGAILLGESNTHFRVYRVISLCRDPTHGTV
jgi:hypothetical protein